MGFGYLQNKKAPTVTLDNINVVVTYVYASTHESTHTHTQHPPLYFLRPTYEVHKLKSSTGSYIRTYIIIYTVSVYPPLESYSSQLSLPFVAQGHDTASSSG